jgi:hypothetical protein
MTTPEPLPAPPRLVGDFLEYAPDQWARASAVVAVEPITGAAAAEAGGTAYLSSLTLLASEAAGRELRRRSIYPVGALVAVLAGLDPGGPYATPERSDLPRPGAAPAPLRGRPGGTP